MYGKRFGELVMYDKLLISSQTPSYQHHHLPWQRTTWITLSRRDASLASQNIGSRLDAQKRAFIIADPT